MVTMILLHRSLHQQRHNQLTSRGSVVIRKLSSRSLQESTSTGKLYSSNHYNRLKSSSSSSSSSSVLYGCETTTEMSRTELSEDNNKNNQQEREFDANYIATKSNTLHYDDRTRPWNNVLERNRSRNRMVVPRTFVSIHVPTTTTTTYTSTSRPYSSHVLKNGDKNSVRNHSIVYDCHHSKQHRQPTSPHIHQQFRSKSIFVSKYNDSMNLSSTDIIEYLSSVGAINNDNLSSDVRITSTHVIVRECPFCTKPINNKTDNMYKLYITLNNGLHFCHRCGASGSWYDMKYKLSSGGGNHTETKHGNNNNNNNTPYNSGHTSTSSYNNSNYSNYQNHTRSNNASLQDYIDRKFAAAHNNHHPPSSHDHSTTTTKALLPPLPMPPSKLQAIYITDLLGGTVSTNESKHGTTSSSPSDTKHSPKNHCYDYLVKERGLSYNTLRHYGVGKASYQFLHNNTTNQWVDTECVTFPWIMSLSQIEQQEHLRGASFDPTPYLRTTTITNTNNSKNQPTQSEKDCSDTGSVSTNGVTGDGNAPKEIQKKRKGRRTKAEIEEARVRMSERENEVDRLNVLKHSTYLTRRIKVRALNDKSKQRLDPPGGGWGFFGYHTIPAGATEIIVTEGEYDAMAVYEATGRPAISLPNGCRSLPIEVLPLLEDFTKIYLWMDNDGPGRDGAATFAKKLGLSRCYLVRPNEYNCRFLPEVEEENDEINAARETKTEQQDIKKKETSGIPTICSITEDDENDENDENDSGERCRGSSGDEQHSFVPIPKDANDALLDGLDLNRIIDDAKLIPHEHIIDFAGIRSDVLHEIMYPEKYVGVPIPSLPKLTEIIKGFRRGEVTVVTGPTGSGKTTFLGQLSIDLAEQEVNVLWGSFEIKNTRLAHKLLQQYAREPLPIGNLSLKHKLYNIADAFQELPLYFMKFHGGSDVDDILDAMDYAVYVMDVEHIILDNMQFMISRQSLQTSTGVGRSSSSSFDKFEIQDVAIEKFRKFATDKNVHVTLVVHPRKEEENTKLSISSVYGSAKATQEADLVMILQKDGIKKYIEIKKNRFNGALGNVPLHYDINTCRYSDEPLQPSMTPSTTSTPTIDIPLHHHTMNRRSSSTSTTSTSNSNSSVTQHQHQLAAYVPPQYIHQPSGSAASTTTTKSKKA